jgi:hypothetical protein
LFVLGLPVSIFSIGYPGTERVWIMRGLRGQPFSMSEALGLTWSFFGRFFLLELLIVPFVGAGAGLGWLIGRSLFGAYFGIVTATVLADFGLTFVTPALAFSTRRVSEALARGLGMIRSEWPRAALYVLVPPLAVLIVLHLGTGAASIRNLRHAFEAIKAGRRPEPLPESTRVLTGCLAALTGVVSLWFKGATAAFYSRRFDVGPYGATPRSTEADMPPRPDIAG